MGLTQPSRNELWTHQQATLWVGVEESGDPVAGVDFDPQLHETPAEFTFELPKDAFLFFGVWRECGPFPVDEYPDPNAIPTSVATAGQKYIAAYLAMVYTPVPELNTRQKVAQVLDVSPQTVSNYWQHVRWTGCPSCGHDQLDPISVWLDAAAAQLDTEVERVEVQLDECAACGAYYTPTVDLPGCGHEPSTPDCVTELVPIVASAAGDDEDTKDYQLVNCPGCRFVSAEPDRHHSSTE